MKGMILFLAASSSDWNSAVLGFIGVVIGAVIGAVAASIGGAFAQWFTRQQERQSVAAALAGEVQGLIDILGMRQAAEGLLQGMRFPIDDHPFLIFEANVGKIGFLPPALASRVAEFYSMARGLVVDFRTLYKGDIPQRLSEDLFRKGLADNIKALKPVAKALVADMREEAARRWYRELWPFQARVSFQKGLNLLKRRIQRPPGNRDRT